MEGDNATSLANETIDTIDALAYPLQRRLVLYKKDVAVLLGVSTKTVERMERTGEIPKRDFHLNGRRCWTVEKFNKWFQDRCSAI